ncbi:MAG TPA: FxDxF family PEP-CTERM protein [Sphingomicrobium sp.]|nr:FxDxF family PEP-CTERM protein [Sphingomicrobium sp.]
MGKSILFAGAAALLVGLSGTANAASCVMNGAVETCTFLPGSPQFQVAFSPDGTISADIGRSGIGSKFDIGPGTGTKAKPLTFQDTYSFFIDATGLGSGSIVTSGSLNSTTDLDFTAVTFNGLPVPRSPKGAFEYAALSDVPITAGEWNSLVVRGIALGNGSYGGNLTFEPTVPEPGTWAMMLLGFGLTGGAMRSSKRKQKLAVSYA